MEISKKYEMEIFEKSGNGYSWKISDGNLWELRDKNLWEIGNGNQEMEIYQPSTSSLKKLSDGNLLDGNQEMEIYQL